MQGRLRAVLVVLFVWCFSVTPVTPAVAGMGSDKAVFQSIVWGLKNSVGYVVTHYPRTVTLLLALYFYKEIFALVRTLLFMLIEEHPRASFVLMLGGLSLFWYLLDRTNPPPSPGSIEALASANVVNGYDP